jgi:hypothetical protein
MRFDGMNTLEGRHLVFAYGSVILVQGAYFCWVLRNWLKLGPEIRKATKPVA